MIGAGPFSYSTTGQSAAKTAHIKPTEGAETADVPASGTTNRFAAEVNNTEVELDQQDIASRNAVEMLGDRVKTSTEIVAASGETSSPTHPNNAGSVTEIFAGMATLPETAATDVPETKRTTEPVPEDATIAEPEGIAAITDTVVKVPAEQPAPSLPPLKSGVTESGPSAAPLSAAIAAREVTDAETDIIQDIEIPEPPIATASIQAETREARKPVKPIASPQTAGVTPPTVAVKQATKTGFEPLAQPIEDGLKAIPNATTSTYETAPVRPVSTGSDPVLSTALTQSFPAQTNVSDNAPDISLLALKAEEGLTSLRREGTMAQLRDTAPTVSPTASTERVPSAAAIARQIAFVLPDAENNRIEVRLDPPELGRVSVQMTITDDGITAVVAAERADVVDILRRHADVLQKELQAAGHRNVTMDFGQSNQGLAGNRQDGEPSQMVFRQSGSPADDPVAIDPSPPIAGRRPLDLRL